MSHINTAKRGYKRNCPELEMEDVVSLCHYTGSSSNSRISCIQNQGQLESVISQMFGLYFTVLWCI
jgi:hypothetical protein